ncbi:cell growth regulator with EF hand domain protein 1-like [Watersipora subatra]|uniref:cell growth regulator with EF hand domain protein 1-like n=1 Tax=Watersipora subatra TaxID=2589382 RepID=UPI00355B08FB
MRVIYRRQSVDFQARSLKSSDSFSHRGGHVCFHELLLKDNNNMVFKYSLTFVCILSAFCFHVFGNSDLNQEQDRTSRFKQHATRDHVLEELQHQINTKQKDQMTDQELQFHYFKLHDFDNNNLLDGLEIVKALTHAHDEATKQAHEDETADAPHIPPRQTEEELSRIIDDVLKDDDLNYDGYVSFYEFMAERGNPPPSA